MHGLLKAIVCTGSDVVVPVTVEGSVVEVVVVEEVDDVDNVEEVEAPGSVVVVLVVVVFHDAVDVGH